MSETIELATAIMVRALRAEIAAGRVDAAQDALWGLVRELGGLARLCAECGGVFNPSRRDKVYCSAQCRNRTNVRAMRRRKAAAKGVQA